MLSRLTRTVLGSSNERRLKALRGRIARINALEPNLEALSDEDLKAKTQEFKTRLANGEKLDALLEEAFATVREAAKRALGQRHFDVQLMGGMVLNEGDIAEMKTGEGKTLVSTLPVYLNALTGQGVHVVTVNEYLAQRDAEWMGQVYERLGMRAGCITSGMDEGARKDAYAADVTYGTNNEFGFDYLRDNMKYSLEAMVQRGHHFAIVDEVDSILIDEARTPLIISGPSEDRSGYYTTINEFIPSLTEDHYEVDEKARSVTLTEEGNEQIEKLLSDAGLLQAESLYDPENISLVHHVNQALRAHILFTRDKDYIVRGGNVVIIDEFTGRMMEGRRYSEGLHQALEAKEGVDIKPENVTLASVTFQNFFRMYGKLAGMTGTAATEASEFENIYGLKVVEIPTNKPVARKDLDDEVYRTLDEKHQAIVEDLTQRYLEGQPVLVGTASIERSEQLSNFLKKHTFERDGKTIKGVPHEVLNARHHEREAHIVAQAGVPGAITVATNMAGRGTDIQLGGNPDYMLADWIETETEKGRPPAEDKVEEKQRAFQEQCENAKAQVVEAGGLYVLGTERHESRRIDNQLRGRSGRQGDPGLSKFYISLEDDLMRIFGHDRLSGMLSKLGVKDGEAIVHPWVTKAIETAQKKVEARNFDVRKNLLKYDDVINDQRKVIFEQRREFLNASDVSEEVAEMRRDTLSEIVNKHAPPKAFPEDWDLSGLEAELEEIFATTFDAAAIAKEEGVDQETLLERLVQAADDQMAKKAVELGSDTLRSIEREVVLWTIDRRWRQHIAQLDHLRQAVGLRGYAQRNPLDEFKSEAFELFERLLGDVRRESTSALARLQVRQAEQPEESPAPTLQEPSTKQMRLQGPPKEDVTSLHAAGGGAPSSQRPPSGAGSQGDQGWGRVPRNAPCPCGSGKKFKHCHGKIAATA